MNYEYCPDYHNREPLSDSRLVPRNQRTKKKQEICIPFLVFKPGKYDGYADYKTGQVLLIN
tara:strand:- start:4957 stop:5139 length:183 start_codon:yes stop_codon:yes gene_type:complete